MQASSIRRYVLVGLIAALVAAAVALVFSMLQADSWRAQMAIAVGSETSVVTPDFGDQLQPVTGTVAQLLRTQVVAKKVIDNLKLGVSPEEFLKKLEVSTKPDAAVIDVSFDSENRLQAVAVLEELGRAFPKLLERPVAPKSSTGATGAGSESEAGTVVKATVFDPPHLLEQKVSPRPLRNSVVAGFLGLLLGLGWVGLRDSREPEPRRRPRPGQDENASGFGAGIDSPQPDA